LSLANLNNKNNNKKTGLYNINGELIKIFNSREELMSYLNISYSTMYRYMSSNNIYNNKYIIKSLDIHIPLNSIYYLYDINNNLIKIFKNRKDIANYLNISTETVRRIVKSGKLYINKYYIKLHEIK
jgi:hypothetical protein